MTTASRFLPARRLAWRFAGPWALCLTLCGSAAALWGQTDPDLEPDPTPTFQEAPPTSGGTHKGMGTLPPQGTNRKAFFALVVGVSEYALSWNNLQFADKDARDFADALRRMGLPQANLRLIENQQATRENILAAARDLFARADANDEIIFFFSGHGGAGVFCPYDSPNYLEHSAIGNVIKASKAQIKLVFADACLSGSLADGGPKGTGFSEQAPAQRPGHPPGLKQAPELPDSLQALRAYETLYAPAAGTPKGTPTRYPTQVVLFASSRSRENSIEHPYVQNGYFTYALLQGMAGQADYSRNGTVSLGEIFAYVRDRVRDLSGDLQHPVMKGQFDPRLVLVKLPQ